MTYNFSFLCDESIWIVLWLSSYHISRECLPTYLTFADFIVLSGIVSYPKVAICHSRNQELI